MTFFAKPRLLLIAIPCILYLTGIYMSLPLNALLFVSISCKEYNSSADDDCTASHVVALASRVLLYGSLAESIPSFFCVGIYGSIADRYGRKIAMIIPALGSFIYFSGLLAIAYFRPPSYAYIYITVSFIHGLMGSFSTFLMSAFSYLADLTTPEERPHKYSVLEAAVFTAQLAGPTASGVWAVHSGFIGPYLCIVLVVSASIAWLSFIPESLPIHAASRLIPITYNPLRSITNIYTFASIKLPSGSSVVPGVFLAFVIFFFTVISNATIFSLYTKNRLNWDSDKTGIFVSIQGLFICLSMLFLRPLVTVITGFEFHNILWILLGCLSWSCFYLWFSFVNTSLAAFLSLTLILLAGPTIPLIRALLANCVPSHLQCKIQSSYASLQTLVTVLSSLTTITYGETVDILPQLCYWLMSGLCFLSTLVLLYIVTTPGVRNNLPNMDGYLSHDRMGFASLEPLLLQRGVSGDKKRLTSRVASTAEIDFTASAIDYMPVDAGYTGFVNRSLDEDFKRAEAATTTTGASDLEARQGLLNGDETSNIDQTTGYSPKPDFANEPQNEVIIALFRKKQK